MVSGKEQIKLIISKTISGFWVILDGPAGFEYSPDGDYCYDNGFNEDTYPKENGVYEVECEISPNFEITIISSKQLIPFENKSTTPT